MTFGGRGSSGTIWSTCLLVSYRCRLLGALQALTGLDRLQLGAVLFGLEPCYHVVLVPCTPKLIDTSPSQTQALCQYRLYCTVPAHVLSLTGSTADAVRSVHGENTARPSLGSVVMARRHEVLPASRLGHTDSH
ncbi:hypothetical protein HYQ46_007511 [Verticillium longisporum]|nr:hypothetical protein HYQ46_007511 [Verticillium longisporum]